MKCYVKTFSDIFVRYLLGDEKNTDILKSFINAVNIDSGFAPVTDVIIKNPYNLRDIENSKESILDVKAVDEEGKIYDIEIISKSTGLSEDEIKLL